MLIPDLTHLQFAVLDILGGVERPGKEVREKLVEADPRQKRSLPAFYQMMSRLEDAGLVKGKNYRITVDGHEVTERRYKAAGNGLKAANDVRRFYAGTAPLGGGLKDA